MKKGQVALFVILGIIIVGGLAFLAYSQRTAVEKAVSGEKPAIDPIKAEIQNCLDNSLIDGLYFIGQSGGYYDSIAEFTDNMVAYYAYEGKNIMPSRQKIVSEIERYIENGVAGCVDASKFPDFEILSERRINASVTILSGRVIADISWPLTLKKSGQTYHIDKFSSEYNARLDLMYESAKAITLNHLSTNSSLIPITYLSEIGLARGIHYSVEEFENRTYVITGLDKISKIDNKPYEFRFAIKLK